MHCNQQYQWILLFVDARIDDSVGASAHARVCQASIILKVIDTSCTAQIELRYNLLADICPCIENFVKPGVQPVLHMHK
jgi:hypothetical protein